MRLEKTTAQWKREMDTLAVLEECLKCFEKENAANSHPVEAELRIDAGFGSYENIALVIAMGYKLYTKPHSNQLAAYLKKQVDEQSAWIRVEANAKLVAWQDMQLKNYPYPFDLALERFYTGKSLKHNVLLHFGADKVTKALPGK
jgi:hypothetical protein